MNTLTHGPVTCRFGHQRRRMTLFLDKTAMNVFNILAFLWRIIFMFTVAMYLFLPSSNNQLPVEPVREIIKKTREYFFN